LIHIEIDNAGIQHVSPIETFSDENWEKIISLNLSASFYTMKESVGHWKSKNDKKTYGRIINISSVHGIVGSINKSAYVASKHGLNGLTKVCALENADSNITCNSICPGWVHTALVQKQIENISKEKEISEEETEIQLVSRKQPSKRFTTCEQVGEMVAFLCSNACSNITGSE
jgi:3-hydroxybutyrate dehydrogenase